MSRDIILSELRLGTPWQTTDPFLFCVHHVDNYPKGNAKMGPAASLSGRQIGQDFASKDGWNMYHGEEVPGFPGHPHRGFETVTIVRKGFIDHSDSLGAKARFGQGDVQWLTAGRGVVHSEMFPLLREDQDNPLELFQIWLNLPARSKMVAPHFLMFWHEQIPRLLLDDGKAEVMLVAGHLGDVTALAPPPGSWAADPRSEVCIWTLSLAPGARLNLPAHSAGLNRSLFFFKGSRLNLSGTHFTRPIGLQLRSDAEALLVNEGDDLVELLLLQGRPIDEPVAQHGPFVMNTRQELQQAFMDYQRTQFGGWPHASHSPVHARDAGRFAVHVDGREERPT